MAHLPILFLFMITLSGCFVTAFGRLLNKPQCEEGATFTVTCDAAAVQLASKFTVIDRLSLSRNDGTTTTILGLVTSGAPTDHPLINTTKPNDNWSITTPTQKQVVDSLRAITSRAVIRVIAQNTDAQCSEGQMYYTCDVSYYDEHWNVNMTSLQDNITVVGGAHIIDLQPDPDNKRFPNRLLSYRVNDILTMTCSAKGPEEYAIQWRMRCPSKLANVQTPSVRWPVQNAIQPAQNEQQQEGNGRMDKCSTYLYRQELKFQIELHHNECTVECQFGNVYDCSFKEKDSMNFTILVPCAGAMNKDKIAVCSVVVMAVIVMFWVN